MENGLHIGGLRVQTRFPEQAPGYVDARRDFELGAGRPADLVLEVRNDLSAAPKEGFGLVFDSGGVWRLSENQAGEQVLEVFNQQSGEAKLLAAAHYDLQAGSGVLHVGANDYGFGRDSHPLTYPLDELLWIQLLSRYAGFILHAFGVLPPEGAVLFSGVSGAGKTTLSRLYTAAYPRRTQLSDDRIIVRKLGAGFHAFGTPWHGDACTWSNETAPLAHVLFIEHGRGGGHALKTLDRAQALSHLLVPFHWTRYRHHRATAYQRRESRRPAYAR